ncbi:MAG: hypothetical protein QW165_03385 [Candidatus Woesearchaeota archaeon]
MTEISTQSEIHPVEIKTKQLEAKLNQLAYLPQRKEVSQYLIEIPYLGFASSRGSGKNISILLSEQEPAGQAQKILALKQTLEATVQRGYIVSTLLGLRGEGSAASAFSGVLCFMPCHWAAYAATAAKILPIFGYAALQNQPSCCNPQTSGEYLFSLTADAVFWSTIGILALGAGRRVLRRNAAKEAAVALRDNYLFENGRPTLGEKITTVTPEFYSEILHAGKAAGLQQMISELATEEYVRAGDSFSSKLSTPLRRGLRKAALSLTNHNYKQLRRNISHAYTRLALLTSKISDETDAEERRITRQISRHYESEAAHSRNSFTPTGLAIKTFNFIKGFGNNNCLYRST